MIARKFHVSGLVDEAAVDAMAVVAAAAVPSTTK